MGRLFQQIRQAVGAERYVISQHANERLRQRRIPAWQVVTGLEDGKLLSERPGATPNPTVEVLQALPDGTQVKAVWAWLAQSQTAKLVTVHFFVDS